MRRLLGLCFLLCVSMGAQSAETPAARLRQALSGLRAFESSFEQQLFDETGALLETSQGTVAIARPGRFDWHYDKPYVQRIVSDGKLLWVYDADLAQVTINTIDPRVADSPARLLGEDFDLEATFKVEDAKPENDLHWIRLQPRAEGRQFREVFIGLASDEHLESMRLRDNLGQTTVIRFQAVKRNPVLDPARFTFVPPKGVDIIHGTGSSP